jgi:hypothetical protein
MSGKIDLPAEAHVRAVLADMLAEAAAGGAKPSVLALEEAHNSTRLGPGRESPQRVTCSLPPPGQPRLISGAVAVRNGHPRQRAHRPADLHGRLSVTPAPMLGADLGDMRAMVATACHPVCCSLASAQIVTEPCAASGTAETADKTSPFS